MFRCKNRGDELITKAAFIGRLLHSIFVVILFIGVALGGGMLGYRYFERMDWTDSFLNASMIHGGMGPVDAMKTDGGKIFAGIYALFSGLAFLVVAGFLFGPMAHRILHSFHYDADEEDKKS
ncbi:MAG: hypothetical protein ABIT37_07030 [Luteolibacter sp.]